MKRLFAALLILSHSAVNADLPSDEDYLAFHIAYASSCPKLFPQRAQRMKIGATVMLCDMSRGNESWLAKVTLEPSFAQKIRQFEAAMKAESPAELERGCKGLEDYPVEGQYCVLVPGDPPRAKLRNLLPAW